MNNKSGHSKEFIEEMKTALEEEKNRLAKELEVLGHKDGGESHSKYAADFPNYGRNDEENVTEMADYQAMSSTTDTLEERMTEVEEALHRIVDGSYGVTANGQLIPEERLRANPAATTLVAGN